MSLTDFQLNSHLSTLASIHKIYHTLHRLNLTEDVSPETHGTGSDLKSDLASCCSRAMPPRKKRRPTAGDDLSAKKSRQDKYAQNIHPSISPALHLCPFHVSVDFPLIHSNIHAYPSI
uniref:Uncharacterized protein n=1 Tax=Sinocyclocheilus rhinocerous TaxID=307959 RepID=A0A673NGB3_9TELE